MSAEVAFRYFTILADMRTGSNFLEDELARFDGINTYGELFNPHFVGRPSAPSVKDVDLRGRNADPVGLLEDVVRTDPALPGFRLFRGHDPRILSHCLNDPACAKVILTRRPIDSFVSLEIARKTGQWWMGNVQKAKRSKARFDADRYAHYLSAVQKYRADIRRQLQTNGQTAFFIDYDEISDEKVLNGLARFLGVDPTKKRASGRKGKPQNPVPLREKFTNPRTAEVALKGSHQPDFDAHPEFEPRRPAPVKGFVGCSFRPILHVALSSRTADAVSAWLIEKDRAASKQPEIGMDQRDLRRWMKSNTAHVSFSVVEHPLLRAYHAFLDTTNGEDTRNPDLCAILERDYAWESGDGAEGLKAFLRFLEPNLKSQTAIFVDRRWASQTAQLQALSSVVIPQRVVTEDQLHEVLGEIPEISRATRTQLEAIADDEMNALVRRAYRRDHMMFGFSDFQAA